eukprot:5301829-Prymnesium_polylepis.1
MGARVCVARRREGGEKRAHARPARAASPPTAHALCPRGACPPAWMARQVGGAELLLKVDSKTQ